MMNGESSTTQNPGESIHCSFRLRWNQGIDRSRIRISSTPRNSEKGVDWGTKRGFAGYMGMITITNKESRLSQNRKFRMTRRRQVILEEINKVDTHPTADEVYEMVRRRLPHISLGTVYRNLQILSECNMIQKLDLAGAQRRFDGNTKKHYHVHCTRCGRVDDVPIEAVVKIQTTFQSASNYKITGHKLELLGLCAQCRKEKKDPTKRSRETAGRRTDNLPQKKERESASSGR